MSDRAVALALSISGTLLLLLATTLMALVAYLFKSLRESVTKLSVGVQELRLVVEGIKVTEQRLLVVEKTMGDHEARIRALEQGL